MYENQAEKTVGTTTSATAGTSLTTSVYHDYRHYRSKNSSSITVLSPTGNTSVVINPHSQSRQRQGKQGAQSYEISPPSDLASGPNVAPVQPRGIRFPNTSFFW